MTAVVLACLSASLFGAMSVALRLAMRRSPDADVGAVVTVAVAFLVAVVAAAIDPGGSPFRHLGQLAFFAAIGLLAPGGSQLLFTLAIRDAGASRTSVVVGAAPLVSVAIALALLGEPLRPALLAGAFLVVLGGAALVGERIRPHDFRAAGMAFAFAAATLFSIRDNLVRWYAGDSAVGSVPAAAAALGAGMLLTFAALAATRRGRLGTLVHARLLPFVPAGILFGLSYVSLFEAYYRGRVTVVSPLVATESLWGVVLSALILRRSELVGPRLVAGALLIVGGGVLIGAFR